jgi:hypothetical protein
MVTPFYCSDSMKLIGQPTDLILTRSLLRVTVSKDGGRQRIHDVKAFLGLRRPQSALRSAIVPRRTDDRSEP